MWAKLFCLSMAKTEGQTHLHGQAQWSKTNGEETQMMQEVQEDGGGGHLSCGVRIVVCSSEKGDDEVWV